MLVMAVLFLLPFVSYAEVDQSVPKYIAETAKAYGVDVQQALYVSWHESHWSLEAKGDYSTTTGKYTSFGIWQIHNPTSKKVRPLTVSQAFDLETSTKWAMQTWSEDGGCFQWSTCTQKYPKAPLLILSSDT